MNSQIDKKLLSHQFFSEWKFWGIGAVLSFFMASILRSGWPEGLIPNFTYPLIRGGDAAFSDWGIQRVIEGWIFNNPRSGYPFGSAFYDFPGSDAGNFLALKILGMISGQFFIASNLFILLGFPFILIATYAFLRAIKLNPWFSLSAAIIYAFFPFHFYRVGHLFYTWYFFIPIYFYCSFYIFFSRNSFFSKPELSRSILWAIALLISASFGVYYALFGVVVILLGGIAGSLSSGSYRNFISSIFATAAIAFGVVLNLLPNFLYHRLHGANPAVGSRSPGESEIYGFKLMHLVLPDPSHPIGKFAKVTSEYLKYTLLNNENAGALLGSIGTLGLILICILIARRFFKEKIDDRLVLFSFIVITLFLFGTMGGFGSLFATFISPSIRGWNRISIFIGLAAVSVFFICLQNFLHKFSFTKKYRLAIPTIALVITSLGFYDQAHWACKPCNEASKAEFNSAVEFVRNIESALPHGAAVYQLPYMPFPEVPPLFNLGTYEQATAFTYSKDLLWSYGVMRGRPGERFYSSLSRESASRQLEVIKKLGFTGLYIDRRGYADNGKQIIDEFSSLLGAPSIAKKDGQIVFFKIQDSGDTSINNSLTYSQVLEKASYYGNEIESRYKANFEDGIDFRKEGYPDFLKSIIGIDGREDSGRWSNANLWPSVIIDFNNPLPKKFKLTLQATGFGPNTGMPSTIKVGNSSQQVVFSENSADVYTLQFDNEKQTSTIEIIPAKPILPGDINPKWKDPRKIGVKLITLKIASI